MNIPILVKEITTALEPVLPAWEIIIVDDNSRDGTVKICDRLLKNKRGGLEDKSLSMKLLHQPFYPGIKALFRFCG